MISPTKMGSPTMTIKTINRMTMKVLMMTNILRAEEEDVEVRPMTAMIIKISPPTVVIYSSLKESFTSPKIIGGGGGAHRLGQNSVGHPTC
jgi:hypothetical protein